MQLRRGKNRCTVYAGKKINKIRFIVGVYMRYYIKKKDVKRIYQMGYAWHVISILNEAYPSGKPRRFTDIEDKMRDKFRIYINHNTLSQHLKALQHFKTDDGDKEVIRKDKEGGYSLSPYFIPFVWKYNDALFISMAQEGNALLPSFDKELTYQIYPELPKDSIQDTDLFGIKQRIQVAIEKERRDGKGIEGVVLVVRVRAEKPLTLMRSAQSH
jgi:hypothetical protein